MKPTRRTAKRAIVSLTLLVLLLISPVTAAQNPRAGNESLPPADAGPDACSCAGELTGCLLRATFELNQCLSRAPGPLGDALCLLRYEVQITQCFQDVSMCFAGCIA